MPLNIPGRRRGPGNWRRPARFDRNLVVIGAGSAGLVAANVAAAARARVTLVERDRMGGDCLNHGCVPSKALIRCAKLAHEMRHADRFGIAAVRPAVAFDRVMAHVHDTIAAIAPHDSVARYTALGVEVLRGHARLVDPWTVEVTPDEGGVRRLTSRATVIATGAAPVLPPLPGIEAVGCLTSDTLWEALRHRAEVPRRVVMLGGGPIGVELAQAFARLGAEVTLVEMAPRILMREDEDAASHVAAALARDGVRLLTGHRAIACGMDGGGKWIEIAHDGAPRRIAFDEIIAAVGRAARLEGFGLEALGIPTGQVVETDAFLRTLHPNILAAGDVAGPFQLTHAAGHQAWIAAMNGLFGDIWPIRCDLRVMPRAIFTDPELARVGLSEAEARAEGIAHEVTRLDLAAVDRAIADGAAGGFVKLLTPPGRDRILGATIVGPHAGDLLAEIVLAMRHGLGLSKILATVHIYPTLAEAARHAAGAWRRRHLNPRLMAVLERFHRWRRG